jgi:hypothetical protein
VPGGLDKERGQARLPNHELIKVEFGSLVEGLLGKIYQALKESLGKVGLPPLFANSQSFSQRW